MSYDNGADNDLIIEITFIEDLFHTTHQLPMVESYAEIFIIFHVSCDVSFLLS